MSNERNIIFDATMLHGHANTRQHQTTLVSNECNISYNIVALNVALV